MRVTDTGAADHFGPCYLLEPFAVSARPRSLQSVWCRSPPACLSAILFDIAPSDGADRGADWTDRAQCPSE